VAPLARREECSKCHSDAHVCKNCEHYDPRVYNECKETQADFVKEKERANFCDYFKVAPLTSGTQKQVDLKAAAEALFKKNSSGS